jgi:GABA permease
MNRHEVATASRVPEDGRSRPHWRDSVLVVANQTAGSDELIEVMRARHRERPTAFTLLVPAGATGREHRGAAARNLAAAVERMRGAGLEVDARLGAHDPHLAVYELYDPREYDQIIVSTLDSSRSRWLRMDLPRRVHGTTGAVVTHVSGSGACRTFC